MHPDGTHAADPTLSEKPAVGKKRKRTAAEKAARQRRKAEFQTVFMNGKQKRVRRPPHVDGVPLEEFLKGADPIFLHEAEMWWLIPEDEHEPYVRPPRREPITADDDTDLPF